MELLDCPELIGRTFSERLVYRTAERLREGREAKMLLVAPRLWQDLFIEHLFNRDPTMRIHDNKKKDRVAFSVAVCGRRVHLIADEKQAENSGCWL